MLKVQSIISSIRTLGDGTIRLVVDSQELAPKDKAELMELHNIPGHFVFSSTGIQEEDIPTVPVEFEQKPPSQRLRNTLFVFYEKSGGKKENFEVYYRKFMEHHIEKLKTKIRELEQIN